MLFPNDPDFPEIDAKALLEPIEPILRAVVIESATLICEMGRQWPIVGKAFEYLAARQHLMNALVVESVKEKVMNGQLPDAEITSQNGFIELMVGAIDLRFKQVDNAGRSKNYPTETNNRYKNQLPLLCENETLERVRLTLGWRWNITATEIEDVVVVYAKGDEIRWRFSILRAAQTVGIPFAKPYDPESGTGVTFPAASKKARKRT